MKSLTVVFLMVTMGLSAQTQNNVIKFGTSRVDVKCFNKAPGGYFRNIEMRSNDTPIRVYFQKNDKSIVDISGLQVYVTYEPNERGGEDVAAVTVDGNKNFWGVKCIYFISITVPNKFVDINGEQKEIAGNLNLDYLGLPMWVSRNTAKL